MTTLVTEHFLNNDPIDQRIKIYRTMHLKAVRLHIYKQGTLPSCTLRLNVFDGTTVVNTTTVSSSQINSSCPKYWHGYITFEFPMACFLSVKSTEPFKIYTLQFVLEDSVDDFSNSISVCRDYEKYIKNTITDFKYEPIFGDETEDGITTTYADSHPLGFELYTLN